MREAAASADRIQKEFSAPEVQAQLRPSAIPWYCLWELNTTCDLRCSICYLPNFANAGPDSKEAATIAQQIIDFGIFYVCLLGGEALLRNDLEEIVGRLRSALVYTKVITNGQMLDASRASSLAAAGINQIEVSFDGLAAESHEASRGGGTYSRALQAVRNAQEAGIPRVGVVWTVHGQNACELDLLPPFLRRIGVAECYVSLFKKTGLLGSRAAFDPVGSDVQKRIRMEIARWKQEDAGLSVVLLPECSCGQTSIVVGFDGEVRTCSFLYKGVGNVFRKPLPDIWRDLRTESTNGAQLGYCSARELRRTASAHSS
jgi:MoaA/NifB/PqqE/SkfB family radical SAM enzyme